MSIVEGQSLKNVPGLLKKIIAGDMWQERVVSQTKQVAKFRTFREFVEEYPPEGLHTTIDLLIDICKSYEDMEAVSMLSGMEAGSKGGNYNPNGANQHVKSEVYVDNINIDHKRKTGAGTSTAYTMRRLAKDFPSIHDEVVQGKMTANAAAVEAGFRKNPMQVPPDAIAAGRYLAQRVDRAWFESLIDAYYKAIEQ